VVLTQFAGRVDARCEVGEEGCLNGGAESLARQVVRVPDDAPAVMALPSRPLITSSLVSPQRGSTISSPRGLNRRSLRASAPETERSPKAIAAMPSSTRAVP
jgi:hypothetical protein